MKCHDEVGALQIGVALQEALLNALYHGNLEASSEMRQQGDQEYLFLAEQRRGRSPYKERKIHLSMNISRFQSVYVVRDEGLGFDVGSLPDPTNPEKLGKLHGRGILLMRGLMDEVSYNKVGNEVTLIKRRDASQL
jgi:hypothetical protein